MEIRQIPLKKNHTGDLASNWEYRYIDSVSLANSAAAEESIRRGDGWNEKQQKHSLGRNWHSGRRTRPMHTTTSDAEVLIRLLAVYVIFYQKNLPDEAKIRR